MIPAPFEYHTPRSIEDAIALLQTLGDEAKLLAGGHSLLPLMKLRLASVSHLVDIGRIEGLSFIRSSDGAISIGVTGMAGAGAGPHCTSARGSSRCSTVA